MQNLENIMKYMELHRLQVGKTSEIIAQQNKKSQLNDFIFKLKEKYGFSSLIIGGSVLASMLSILGMVVIIKI